jgi:hypothetical protein
MYMAQTHSEINVHTHFSTSVNWGSHTSEDVDRNIILGCDAVWSRRQMQTFWRFLSPESSSGFHFSFAAHRSGHLNEYGNWKICLSKAVPRLRDYVSLFHQWTPYETMFQAKLTDLDDDDYYHYHVNGVKLRLRTVATNGPIVHLPGDTWA